MACIGKIIADTKKKSRIAAEAKTQARAAFRKKQRRLEAPSLIFIDEFAINTALTRTYARAPKGERAEVREPFNHGVNSSVINAFGLRGWCASMMIEGAVDQAVFDVYVEHFLVPKLCPGDVVLLDNIKFHHSLYAIRLIEQTGARVEHLPAYSPDFNPIEQCISKLKAILRGIKADTQRKLRNALARAMAQVTLEDIRGWFHHCGYTYSLN